MVSEFRTIESRTCVRFVVRSFENDFIDVVNRADGCWSWLGRIGGRQELSMCRSCGCVTRGMMLHEAIHALGYDHMHNHINRDNFVQILWNNIMSGADTEFQRVNPAHYDNFNTAYDLRSVMHYDRRAWSRNGQDTIIPHDRNFLNIIGAITMSDGDFLRINRMYGCRV